MNRARPGTRLSSVAARRRSKPSLVARVRVMWIVLLLAGVSAALAVYAAMMWPGFYPKMVGVSGERHVSAHEVIQAAGLNDRTNLWLQSKRKAEERIEALPYVKKAALHRRIPARVTIAVTERTPAALVALGDGSLALIDDEGRILQRGVERSDAYVVFSNLRTPLAPAGTFITDATVGRLLRDAHALAAAGVEVRSMGFEKFDELSIVTRKGLRVLFGNDADLPQKARLIDPILRTVGSRLGHVAALDLRAPKTPVIVNR